MDAGGSGYDDQATLPPSVYIVVRNHGYEIFFELQPSEFDGKGEKKSDEEDDDAEPKNGDDDVEMKDRDIKRQKNDSKVSLGMKNSCSAPAKMASTYNAMALADKAISTTPPSLNISLSPMKMEAFATESSVILETPLSQQGTHEIEEKVRPCILEEPKYSSSGFGGRP
ncbi:hypothetical protein GUJ93_ZPchr0006g40793 [Zizania palustris]|uniref:Uncharacterized protein n=1 Tax=Zizania palustris TaxID=103762 RepID=A0A8J5T0T4_ZIZPA|nr:hypothetical protein GUJ93_ZPchr0006g40793 [Zizania palustris]